MTKILLATVGVLLVIGLIGVGTLATFQEVEAGTPSGPEPELYFHNLTVSTTQAGIGEIVTIKVTVTNIDYPGAGEVTLEINGVVEETKEVTLGRSEGTVLSFTVSKDVPGTYSFEIISSTQEGFIISGSFTVRAVTAEPEPFNWALIGGIIAAVVVAGLIVYFLVRRKAA